MVSSRSRQGPAPARTQRAHGQGGVALVLVIILIGALAVRFVPLLRGSEGGPGGAGRPVAAASLMRTAAPVRSRPGVEMAVPTAAPSVASLRAQAPLTAGAEVLQAHPPTVVSAADGRAPPPGASLMESATVGGGWSSRGPPGPASLR